MNLPYHQPLIGPTIFNESNVPPVTINLPQNLMAFVPYMTAFMLNRAMESKDLGAGRMACLNSFVINNFQNPNLSQWVEVALRIAFDKASKSGNPNNVQAFLNEAAGEALMYWTSIITSTTPEIYARSNPQAQGAANANHASWNNIKASLFNLNFSTMSNPVAQGYGQQQYGQPQQPQYGQPPQQYNQPQGHGIAQWGANTQVTSPAPQQETYNNNPGMGWGQHPSPTSVVSQPTAAEVTKQAAWFNKSQSDYPQAQSEQPVSAPIRSPQEFFQATQEVAPVAPALDHSKVPSTTIRNGHEMDINNHALPYFGSDALIDLSARRMDLREDAIKLARETRRRAEDPSPVLLEMNLGLEMSVDTAILMTRGALAISAKEQKPSAFRQFHNILNPTICHPTNIELMKIMTGNTILRDLPVKFQVFVKTLNTPGKPTDEEQQTINFLAYLDRKLATTITHYIRHNMRIKGAKLTSFCEGIEAFYAYLETLGPKQVEAFEIWASKLMSSFRSNYNEAAGEFVKGWFSGDTEIPIGYFPQPISITLLELTNKELGYDTSPDGTLVDSHIAHTLHDLVSSLHINKNALGLFTTVDYLVTVDDYRYILAESSVEPGKFFLYTDK